MRKTIFSTLVLLLLASGAALAQKAETPAPAQQIQLNEQTFFFTEPYTYLDPPTREVIGMCLDLDYAEIRYPFGFVNTLNSDQPLIDYRKRIKVTEADQLEKIKNKTQLDVGDRVTVISSAGQVYPARITGFSYAGNSPSTVVVNADLKLEAENIDSSVYSGHGVALRGMWNIPPQKLSAEKALPKSDPLHPKLVNLCASDLQKGMVISDTQIIPATLENGGDKYYFVSFWQRPETDYEIEDVVLKSCLFKPLRDGWAKAEMPQALQLIQVFDLDQDNKAEIFAMTGDGAEICYIYLAPKGDSYTLVRKGMCAGY